MGSSQLIPAGSAWISLTRTDLPIEAVEMLCAGAGFALAWPKVKGV